MNLKFRMESERYSYARKLARERLENLPKETREKYGDESLLSDMEHQILLRLPLSREMSRTRQRYET